MIQCCNHKCPGEWFHLQCVGLQVAPVGDWFCDEDCRDSGGYIYCVCHSRKGREDRLMLKCALGGDCTRREKYHRTCIGANQQAVRGMYIFPNIGDKMLCVVIIRQFFLQMLQVVRGTAVRDARLVKVRITSTNTASTWSGKAFRFWQAATLCGKVTVLRFCEAGSFSCHNSGASTTPSTSSLHICSNPVCMIAIKKSEIMHVASC